MLEKLQQLKKMGAYAIQLSYGGYIGQNDFDTPIMEREALLTFFPVGHFGKVKCYFSGTVQELLEFDFNVLPTHVIFSEEELKLHKYIMTCLDSEEVSKITDLSTLFLKE